MIIGPESTGKTTLAKQLADRFGTTWVPEYAREYIDALDRPYKKADLLEIAKVQLEREEQAMSKAKYILFCDTNLWVIKVWSEYKYGSCHPWVEQQIEQRSYDYYFLTYTDIPWLTDPQREHPQEREALFQIYQQHLGSQPTPFQIIKGNQEQRLQQAIALIDTIV